MITDNGECPIESANDMNVPVNSFLIQADTKEEIMELVQKHVVPLYEVALNNLKTVGANYYWEPKE